MSKLTPIIFFGTEDYSGIVLEKIVSAGWPIHAVVTKPDFKSGRGQELTAPKVKTLALANDIAVWQPAKLDDIRDSITESKCDIAVLVAFGKIIPQWMLDMFPGGIINVHPSLLPLWRGPAPVEFAILNGDKKTGVSIMRLTAGMDAGPVYLQQEVKLDGSETKTELYNRLFTLGGQILVESLDMIIHGEIRPKEQAEHLATYSKMIKKEDGKLDLINKTAEELDREIRAYQGWPKSYTKLGKVDAAITSASVVPSDLTPGEIEVVDDGNFIALFIYCKHGNLDVGKLQPAGKKEMNVREFLSGYKNQIL